MTESLDITMQLAYMARLLVASGCGILIGYERKNRLKEAGMRTHLIVALGAALMMLVSKYGFFDLAGYNDFLRVDASRIASQIVSGVGFLGAGMIFVRNRSVTGLTTAAGIWTTAGIGMAIGAGMYAVGIFCTVVVLGTQYLLHGRLQQAMPDLLSLSIRVQEGNVADTLKTLQDAGAQLVNMDVTHKKSGIARLDLRIKLCGGEDPLKLIELLESRPYVIEVGD